ncbi:MAG: hypothetical protein Q8O19_07610, partial [Rectinemataceae bacterium]|nr:hypothetical protein [Rectinemataceae bacterium]
YTTEVEDPEPQGLGVVNSNIILSPTSDYGLPTTGLCLPSSICPPFDVECSTFISLSPLNLEPFILRG